MKKKILSLILVVSTIILSKNVNAASYNYDINGKPRESAEGYIVENTIYSETVFKNNSNKFMSLQDLQVVNDKIYILDSGNFAISSEENVKSRVFVFDSKFNLEYTINSFYSFSDKPVVPDIPKPKEKPTLENPLNPTETVTPEGKQKDRFYFKNAQGFYVTEDRIYVADTDNNRVIVMHLNGEYDFTINTPKDEVFSETNRFFPVKIAVDSGKRIYIIAKNIYEGMIQLNRFGEFEMYVGVNKIVISPFERLRRKFMTEAQLERIKLNLPREFTNLTVDSKNFIYATVKPPEDSNQNALIKCINPSGKDVIKGPKPSQMPRGDLVYVASGGATRVITKASNLVSITVNPSGLYTALDSKRGRLFTYNNEGQLLYISGHLGSQSDAIGKPVSVKYFGNDLLVLDQSNNSILIFKETETGKLINEASELHKNGYFEEATEKWLEVIKLNSNYQMAYNHIGKLILNDESNEVIKKIDPTFDENDLKQRYKIAMKYFDLGEDQKYYSDAYKQYRTLILQENFDWIMTTIVIVVGGLITFKIVRYVKKRKSED